MNVRQTTLDDIDGILHVRQDPNVVPHQYRLDENRYSKELKQILGGGDNTGVSTTRYSSLDENGELVGYVRHDHYSIDGVIKSLCRSRHTSSSIPRRVANLRIAFGIRTMFLGVTIVAASMSLNMVPIHSIESPTMYFTNGDEVRFERNSHGWPMDIGVLSRRSAENEIGKTPTGGSIRNFNYYLRIPNPVSILFNSFVATVIVLMMAATIRSATWGVNKLLDRKRRSFVVDIATPNTPPRST